MVRKWFVFYYKNPDYTKIKSETAKENHKIIKSIIEELDSDLMRLFIKEFYNTDKKQANKLVRDFSDYNDLSVNYVWEVIHETERKYCKRRKI